MANEDAQPIIIKKVVKGGGGHHGGAWKVAYADFVTAMMAFFMLLWLLNVVTDEAKDVISSYFDPSNPRIAMEQSGAGGVLGGLSVSQQGAMATTAQALDSPELSGYAGEVEEKDEKEKDAQEELESKQKALEILEEQLRGAEDAAFQEAIEKLEESIKFEKELQEMAENLKMDMTPEGLRIQLIDQEDRPLFPQGSAAMFDYTAALISAVTDIVLGLKQDISISGHTEAEPETTDNTTLDPADPDSYTNWELSADRANAARRVLQENGLPEYRIKSVIGRADREPFIEHDPYDPRNRRISIVVLRESLEEAIERGAFEGLKDDINTTADQSDPSAADLDEPTDGSGPSGIGDGLDEAKDEDVNVEEQEPGVNHPAKDLYERTPGQVVFP